MPALKSEPSACVLHVVAEAAGVVDDALLLQDRADGRGVVAGRDHHRDRRPVRVGRGRRRARAVIRDDPPGAASPATTSATSTARRASRRAVSDTPREGGRPPPRRRPARPPGARGHRRRKPLVVRLDRYRAASLQLLDEVERLDRLAAVLSPERERHPDHDPLGVEVRDRREQLAIPAGGEPAARPPPAGRARPSRRSRRRPCGRGRSRPRAPSSGRSRRCSRIRSAAACTASPSWDASEPPARASAGAPPAAPVTIGATSRITSTAESPRACAPPSKLATRCALPPASPPSTTAAGESFARTRSDSCSSWSASASSMTSATIHTPPPRTRRRSARRRRRSPRRGPRARIGGLLDLGLELGDPAAQRRRLGGLAAQVLERGGRP